MAFYKQDIVDINLNTGSIFRSFLAHSIGFKNDDADRFGIRCFRDGEPVDLSGASCQAVFMAPNGVNIALTSYGTVSGNVAYVTLPQACYDYEGQFCLSIQLVGGGVTGTMRIVDGMVVNTGASGAVTPTSAVPTYQEILATYDAMVAATSAANLAIAEEFDASKNYPAGKNVINDGALYVLPNGHTAGTTWANTTKVASNLGDQVSELKSALIPFPVYPDSKYGTSGQNLRTLGNGKTQWVDQGLPTDEQTAEAVSAWLDDHPEATTTVQDWSLTYKKLVKGTLGFVTPMMYGAKADGVTDDLQAVQDALQHGGVVYFPEGTYYISNGIHIVKSNTFMVLSPGAVIKCDQVTTAVQLVGDDGIERTVNGGATVTIGWTSANMDDVPIIHDVGIMGGTVQNTSSGDNENAIGFTHVYNFVCDNVKIPLCNRKGITAQVNCKDGKISRNTIGDCGYYAITIETGCENVLVVGNTIVNTATGGIWDFSNIHSIVTDNFINCNGDGIFFNYTNGLIANNIIFATGRGIAKIYNISGNTHETTISNNNIESSLHGIYVASVDIHTKVTGNNVKKPPSGNYGLFFSSAYISAMSNDCGSILVNPVLGETILYDNVYDSKYFGSQNNSNYLTIIDGTDNFIIPYDHSQLTGTSGTVWNNDLVKSGNVVHLFFWNSPDSEFEGKSDVIGIIPTGYVPRRTQLILGRMIINGEEKFSTFKINTDGTVTQDTTSGTYYGPLIEGVYVL